MNLYKNKISGSIKTPIGIIGIMEENNKIYSLQWTNKVIQSPSPIISNTLLKISNYFRKKLEINSIPIMLNTTKLQISILKTIMKIPIGKFSTYGFIAKKINTHPRVVGRTCAINPLPLIIPCHRVLRSDKSLGGYSCGKGLKTKRWLLNHENVDL